ncbi:sigma-54 dependent transcriptional regulator [Methylacidimicrobium sp. B4]|uniref:sigma-54-dependent transcriptional regulator n=1 Tax=Methylacidimicrobium sp. B4 TaxID=2796139 RepID=UPI001A8ED877|nr:sigma-54 dependent transcriptional regulator [Methylacidimicrobium sp. B4]QSR83835.1 sigma-54-dependent Fis family transcriptional regulator [Methylacidimicrobium sp. B4]
MNEHPGLLIVDDERNAREGLRRAFSEEFETYTAEGVAAAKSILEDEAIDLVLLDLRLGKESGLDLLEFSRNLPTSPACVIMTAYGSVDNAVEAIKRGAYDYVTKPLDLGKLAIVLRRAVRSRQVETENQNLREQLGWKFGLERIIGKSAAMMPVVEKIRQVAGSRATVLLEGESGTGKELAAHALHLASPRRAYPFVAVHCAALSPQLLESELFGHERGAFTGALEKRIGRFEEAQRGTIFLDEIGEIDATTQVKLLRVLGEKTIQRVGSNKAISIDVRVIAATNRNLERMVTDGTFREDLFFRLNVVRIVLPPLRERKEDLPLLFEAFIGEFARENGKRVSGLTKDAEKLLCQYDWPGNVRELRMALEHGVVMTQGSLITREDLPERICVPSALRAAHGTAPASMTLREAEKQWILQALHSCGGNRSEAARKLGISRKTLLRKIASVPLEDRAV